MATTFLGFGSGVDGAASLSGTWSPTRASCSGSSTSLTASPTGFSANDIVFVHQSRGASAGQWELAQIASVGSGLNLVNSLTYTYTDSGDSQAQVTKIPQYSQLTIGSSFNPPAWDGDLGGLFVVMVSGVMTVSSTLTASGLGFRGGSGGSAAIEVCDSGDTGESALQPSIAGGSGGFGTSPSPAVAPSNSNGGSGAQGQRSPDGGAGGGGGAGGANGVDGTGIGSISGAMQGAAVGSASLTSSLLFGGGAGGGGKAKDPLGQGGGNGGTGGGIILVYANQFVVTGTVNLSGATGQNGQGGAGGGGGGGGGGSFLLFSTSATLGSNLITTAGGNGGTGDAAGGSGGAGGAGRMQFECCSLTGSVSSYGTLTNNTGGQTFCQGLFAGMV